MPVQVETQEAKFAETLGDLVVYLEQDRSLGMTPEALALVTEYLSKAKEVIVAVNEERQQAIAELAELIDAVESEDTDNYLVGQLYDAAFDAGFESGIEAEQQGYFGEELYTYDEVKDTAQASIEDTMREIIADHLEVSENDPRVIKFVASLSDRHLLKNDLDAMRGLLALADKFRADVDANS